MLRHYPEAEACGGNTSAASLSCKPNTSMDPALNLADSRRWKLPSRRNWLHSNIRLEIGTRYEC